jgi:hypothetical protein
MLTKIKYENKIIVKDLQEIPASFDEFKINNISYMVIELNFNYKEDILELELKPGLFVYIERQRTFIL